MHFSNLREVREFWSPLTELKGMLGLCILFFVSLSSCASLQGDSEHIPEQERVFYLNLRDNDSIDIESIQANGNGQRLLGNYSKNRAPNELMEFLFYAEQIDVSPDGKTLLYSSQWENEPEITHVKIDGTDLHLLTSNDIPDIFPKWSPDGKKIVFTRMTPKYAHVWVMNSDGSGQQQLSKNLNGASHPHWSPDGQRILFSSIDDDQHIAEIYTINVDGSNLKQLTYNGYSSIDARWSPDGKTIAYAAFRQGMGGGSPSEIELIPSSGGTPEILTQLKQFSFNLRWSPDGGKIVFVSSPQSDPENRDQLYKIDLSSRKVNKITGGNWAHLGPEWSQDGEYLICMALSTNPKQAQIKIIDLNGNSIRTISPQNGLSTWPVWSY